jgi:hypothetical protein
VPTSFALLSVSEGYDKAELFRQALAYSSTAESSLRKATE